MKILPFVFLSSFGSAFAADLPSLDVLPSQSNAPVFLFELPNRGALAVFLDNLAIGLGTSGSIKNAKAAIETAVNAKGILAISCKDSHTVNAVEKALSAAAPGSLSALTVHLSDQPKCSAKFLQRIEQAGAKRS